ncbi:phosphopantothenoylcysteine decarboxylase [Sulfolobales archaeon HS-7]|nr:phosphopantothenoylcysteine decarboxylase [Sulfolobales archaeon HS-7]
MHPSKNIKGEFSDLLDGKKILLGITSSVSLYKSIDLARNLMRYGAEVTVVMSKKATKLISPEMFRWATSNHPVVEITGELEHIQLAKESSLMLISPITANSLSKLAYGIGDDTIPLVALTVLAYGKPVIIVPTMHFAMYESFQVSEAIERLKEHNVTIIPPNKIRDVAHFPPEQLIIEKTVSMAIRGEDLKGINVLVTAGPTREHLDPVRFLTNSSTGRMGISIANNAHYRGANVYLVSGPVESNVKYFGEKRIQVTTTEDMFNAVNKIVENNKIDVAILAGAPADFRFNVSYDTKLDSRASLPNISIEVTRKISEGLKGKCKLIVGFAAETVDNDEELVEKAKKKLELHNFNIIFANNVKRKDIGFASEYNEVIAVRKGGEVTRIQKSMKNVIAFNILDIVKDELSKVT